MAIPFNLPSEEDTEEYYRRLDQLLADLYDVLRHILFRPRAQQPAHNHQQQQAPVVDPHGDNESEDHEPPDHGGEHPPSPDALEQRLHPLPDLVANVGSSSAAPSRPLGRGHPRRHQDGRRRRRDSTTNSSTPGEDSQQSPGSAPGDLPALPPRKPRDSKKRCSSLRRKPCCPASLKFSHSLKTSAENWVMVGEELRKIAEDFRSKTTATSNTTTSRTDTSQLKDRVADLPRTKRVELKASSLLSLLVPAPFCGSVWTTVIIIVGWKLLMRQNR